MTMEIRDYSVGDRERILKLFELSFGKKMDSAFWEWRFEKNILGKKMIKLMWDCSELVGHYALSPVELEVGGEKLLSALSMTTMTHPAYAGKGIFTALASELFDDQFRNEGLKMVWGFPNANSHPGFISKLKWRDVGVLPVFSAAADNFRKYASPREPISQFTDGHAQACRAAAAGYRVRVKKSSRYLNWRYFDCPGKNYASFEVQDNGFDWYVVSKLFVADSGPQLDILEMASPLDPKIIASLLGAALAFWDRESTVLRVNMWLPLNDPRHIALEKMGFSLQAPVTYLAARVFSSGKHEEIAGDLNNWMLSMGDSDVF